MGSYAVWIDFFKREETSWSDVEYFIENFKSVLQFDEHEISVLYEQFVDYQLIDTNEAPKDMLDNATFNEFEDSTVEYHIDVILVPSEAIAKLHWEQLEISLVVSSSSNCFADSTFKCWHLTCINLSE